MKLSLVAVSAFALCNVGVASAALASYDFENAELNAINLNVGSVPNFTGGLAALGVTSSTLSSTNGTTGQRGVYTSNWLHRNRIRSRRLNDPLHTGHRPYV